ncbi:Mrp/NBP35 family ATP-binding protein [Picrophilus oshimae]|uniref:Iron-sulfur cluster carrier protein n=1 Tax=Picrophilus torridus (strain ATCC 700027 / DSM 9790 / JCM 10055 / NBRC 100828 / KAW 2/3) TaxID=1122961 RepID=A0A8G2FWA9_PICTO|nr:Mrp/NBP35 family ATP-binding protein [Picrophilus oshimae]SMD30641.1 ATP-binding protein involved in chromosome partitioning [Picrophilus oshimae DSM 9789]
MTGNIKINPPPPRPMMTPEKSLKYRVKHTILIMSGKGGVGKSTVAANLAVALAGKNLNVGLLDADINGPDDPKMLGIENEKVYGDEKGIIPAKTKYNVDVISMGLIIPRETAVIWRGSLRHKAIQQFLEDVIWDGKDILVVDLPPGTGDEPLSICQLIPNADGIVIVITPQDVALNDAVKAIDFASKVKIPVIGLIENMSGFICPHCGKETDIFKSGGGKKLAEQYNINFLGKIPIIPEIVEDSDKGIPAAAENEFARKFFDDVAENIIKNLKN